MFWSDWGYPARIARAYMDGSSDRSFVSDNIHWPNGLAIDYPNQRLYWTDAKAMTLESINLDGTDRRVSITFVCIEFVNCFRDVRYFYTESWKLDLPMEKNILSYGILSSTIRRWQLINRELNCFSSFVQP